MRTNVAKATILFDKVQQCRTARAVNSALASEQSADVRQKAASLLIKTENKNWWKALLCIQNLPPTSDLYMEIVKKSPLATKAPLPTRHRPKVDPSTLPEKPQKTILPRTPKELFLAVKTPLEQDLLGSAMTLLEKASISNRLPRPSSALRLLSTQDSGEDAFRAAAACDPTKPLPIASSRWLYFRTASSLMYTHILQSPTGRRGSAYENVYDIMVQHPQFAVDALQYKTVAKRFIGNAERDTAHIARFLAECATNNDLTRRHHVWAAMHTVLSCLTLSTSSVIQLLEASTLLLQQRRQCDEPINGNSILTVAAIVDAMSKHHPNLPEDKYRSVFYFVVELEQVPQLREHAAWMATRFGCSDTIASNDLRKQIVKTTPTQNLDASSQLMLSPANSAWMKALQIATNLRSGGISSASSTVLRGVLDGMADTSDPTSMWEAAFSVVSHFDRCEQVPFVQAVESDALSKIASHHNVWETALNNTLLSHEKRHVPVPKPIMENLHSVVIHRADWQTSVGLLRSSLRQRTASLQMCLETVVKSLDAPDHTAAIDLLRTVRNIHTFHNQCVTTSTIRDLILEHALRADVSASVENYVLFLLELMKLENSSSNGALFVEAASPSAVDRTHLLGLCYALLVVHVKKLAASKLKTNSEAMNRVSKRTLGMLSEAAVANGSDSIVDIFAETKVIVMTKFDTRIQSTIRLAFASFVGSLVDHFDVDGAMEEALTEYACLPEHEVFRLKEALVVGTLGASVL